jgi:hypothetical protein
MLFQQPPKCLGRTRHQGRSQNSVDDESQIRRPCALVSLASCSRRMQRSAQSSAQRSALGAHTEATLQLLASPYAVWPAWLPLPSRGGEVVADS